MTEKTETFEYVIYVNDVMEAGVIADSFEHARTEINHYYNLYNADALNAARYRWLRETTTRVTNHNGEKIEVSPELMDLTVDAALAAQSKGAQG